MTFGSGVNTGFNLNSSGTSSGFTFGSSGATTTSTNTITNQTTKTTSGFAFGATATSAASTTSAGLGSSLFGAKTSTATVTPFGAAATTSATASTTTALQTQTTSQPAFKGLGGVDLASSTNNNNDKRDASGVISQAVKDQAVPEEICKDVTAFENYATKQKEESNEVAKFSVRSLHKITEEINALSSSLAAISSAVQRNKASVEKLRSEFGEQLKHVEMMQRTQNTPPALQHDNIAPIRYFAELVVSFDSSMQVYRQQIDELENHLHSLSQSNMLTPQDISLALMKIQETFITLASNLHSVHDNVKHLKEQYLAYRRVVHGDPTDVFAVEKENKCKENKSIRIEGPSPLQNLSNVAALAMATMLQQPQQQAPPQQSFFKQSFGTTGTGTSNPFGIKTTTGGLFGSKPVVTASNSLFSSTTSTGFGGFGPATRSSSAGYTSASGSAFFGNTTFNSSAGVTFGGSALRPAFDLKLPTNSKRNKKVL